MSSSDAIPGGPPPVRLETAKEWWHRSQHEKIRRQRFGSAGDSAPRDPTTAAWAFCGGQTGIGFVDMCLRQPRSGLKSSTRGDSSLPILHIRGKVGKTWTVISLAARFVVATRNAYSLKGQIRFYRDQVKRSDLPTGEIECPLVILLDTNHQVTPDKIAKCIRSQLLREPGENSNDGRAENESVVALEKEIDACLARIHIFHALDPTFGNPIISWTPLLETIRAELGDRTEVDGDNVSTCTTQSPSALTPTLVLWDGLCDDVLNWDDISTRMEILRLLSRLHTGIGNQELHPAVMLVTTSRGPEHEWDNKYVTHRVQLENAAIDPPGLAYNIQDDSNDHEPDEKRIQRHAYIATTSGGHHVPFSITDSGILS